MLDLFHPSTHAWTPHLGPDKQGLLHKGIDDKALYTGQGAVGPTKHFPSMTAAMPLVLFGDSSST